MAQQTDAATDELLDQVKTFGHDDEEALIDFVEAAIPEIREHLENNREQAQNVTSVEKSVSDVLSAENVRDIEVRARAFENPKVTVWLRECPMWANDATRTTFHPHGLNAYNGKVTMSFDVRPF